MLLGVPVERLSKPFVVSEQYTTADGESVRRNAAAISRDMSAFAYQESDLAPKALELYRPPLHVRSAQPGTPEGREKAKGLSVGGWGTFPYRRSPRGLLVIDAGPWVKAWFSIPLHRTTVSTHFLGGAASPGHITLRVATSV